MPGQRQPDRITAARKAPFETAQLHEWQESINLQRNLELTLSNHHFPALIHWSTPMVLQGCNSSAFFIRAELKEILNNSSSTADNSGGVDN